MYSAREYRRKASHIPQDLHFWLYADGSLTQQLTKLAQGQFSVVLIGEKMQKISRADAQWLGVPYGQIAWVRESYLYGSTTQPWVKAKSIFPIQSLKKRARIFPHIRQRPIGKILFQRTKPQCQRRVLTLADGWTRQSRYVWHHCPLIVQETFLPAFEQFLQEQSL